MPSFLPKIIDGIIALQVRYLVTTFVGFFSSLILIRVLGTYDFGLLSLALATLSIASSFLDIGLGSLLTSEVAREIGMGKHGHAKALLWRYMQLELFFGFFLSLSIFLFAGVLETYYGSSIKGLVRIGSLLIFITGLYNIYTVAYSSNSKFKYLSATNIIETIAQLIFVLVLVYSLKLGVFGALLSYTFSKFSALILTFPLFLRTLAPFKVHERQRESLFYKTMIDQGTFVILTSQIKTLVVDMPPWIIKYFLGVEAVGIFSVALKFHNLFLNLMKTMEDVLLPTIAEISKEKVEQLFYKSIKYSLVFSVPLFLGAELLSGWVIPLLFTERYEASILIFRILILTLPIYSFGLPLRPLYFRARAQKFLFISYATSLIFFIPSTIMLTYIFGNVGMAIAILIHWISIIILRYAFLGGIVGLSLNLWNIFRSDDYDKILVARARERIKNVLKELI